MILDGKIILNKKSTSVVLFILFMAITEYNPLLAQSQTEVHNLSAEDISASDKSIYLSDVWLFKAGDDPRRASPALADTAWQKVSTYLGPSELPFLNWNGIGWFRIHIKVDSSLVDYPLALIMQQHNGASQIYLDGKMIAEIGTVSSSKKGYKGERKFNPVPIVFPDTAAHVLAVRYANYNAAYFNKFNSLGFTAGFRFFLGDLDYYSSHDNAAGHPLQTKLPVFFIGALLAFTIIHFLLFLFYPAEKRNLYFALFTGMLVILIYTLYALDITFSPLGALFYYRFSLICWLATLVLALRFTYSLMQRKTPVSFWFFLALSILFAALSWFSTNKYAWLREFFVLLMLLEIIRVLLFSLFRKKKGVWIVAVGVLFFVIGILYKMLIDVNVIAGEPVAASIYGSAAMIFAMSIYLSRDFARTNRQLEQKLAEVKHLSKRALDEERKSQKRETERKLLAAENERKSKELEEARALQLSMLPKKIPGTSCWDIAVFMETAHEVGGDYYDFSDSERESLTIALGDATGHGMSAGIMVAAVKSYFHTLADGDDLIEILRQISSGIRNMNLKLMFMGLQLLKCRQNSVSIVSAGMPAPLWFKNDLRTVDELRLKGLPLGTKAQYPYRTYKLQATPGDVILLMSDGLTELFNSEREQLGQARIKQKLEECGGDSASQILSQLKILTDQWLGGRHHEDDITIIVMKAK